MILMRNSVLFLLTVLMTSCLSSRIENLSLNKDKEHEIETNIRVPLVLKNAPLKKHSLIERMQYFETPGLGIAVIEDAKIVWAKGFGFREHGKKEKVDIDTVFQAASMSKPVAALGVLSLVKSGKIKLDTNVNEYLRSWKVQENSLTNNEKVTVRRLLSHTAGFTDGNGFPC